MSSKTSKKTTVTQSSSSQRSGSRSSTPQAQSTRPQSPGLSPTRFSRLQEKADLQNLNDRLACYIDRVRKLEAENSGLVRQVQTSQETITRETTTLKSMYEQELNVARRLLDDVSREKARLEIDAKRIFEDHADVVSRLEKKTKECANAERQLKVLEPKVNDLQTKYNQAVSERKKSDDLVAELEKERDKLRKQTADLRKLLETETLLRIDLENNLQSVKEAANFKEEVHTKELSETRMRKQVEISEIDGRLSEQYEEKLQKSLAELRDQYEAQMRSNRDEIETLYDNKLRNSQNLAARSSSAHANVMEENRSYRVQVDGLSGRIAELESTNAGLVARMQDLERLMQAERDSSYSQRQQLELELKRLTEEMENHLQEYQDLMDIKVALDIEIAAYRKLLESEETRLNYSPVQSPGVQGFRATPSRRTPVVVGRKRKRFEETDERSASQFAVKSQAKGDVEISEVCPEGKFVRLLNKGDKEVSLSGWQLIRNAGDRESTYKFHRTTKIEPQGNVTVWSSDSKVTHEPPSNLVMKSQKWTVADTMSTLLKNNAGDEMALSERSKMQLSESRHRESSAFLGSQRLGAEEMYHQQGDPEGQDRCAIM